MCNFQLACLLAVAASAHGSPYGDGLGAWGGYGAGYGNYDNYYDTNDMKYLHDMSMTPCCNKNYYLSTLKILYQNTI